MSIVRYTKLGVVSAVSLGAMLGVSLLEEGLSNEAYAQDVKVPAYGEVYKSENYPYKLNIQPKITDSNGATYTLGGGEYTITQYEEYDEQGKSTPVDGEGVKLTLTEGGSNIAEVSEDGSYKVKNTVRVPGYLLDTKEYKYNFPNGKVHNVYSEYDNRHTYDLNPKLTPAKGEFNFTKTSDDNKTPLQGVEFEIYQTRSEALQKDFGEGDKKVGTVVTGTDGTVRTGELEEGTYYLVETKTVKGHALDKSKIYFKIGVESDGITPFSREIEDKGDLINKDNHFLNFITPTIDKKVGVGQPLGEESFHDGVQNASLGEYITYYTKLDVPKDVERYKEFKIVYTSDTRLDNKYMKYSIRVITGNDKEGILDETTDYNISVEDNVATIEFTESGRKKLTNGNVRLMYNTTIGRGKGLNTGDKLNNKVELFYNNGLGESGKIEDSVGIEVKEGVLQIDKLDGREQSTKLDGAKFKLYMEQPDTGGLEMKIDPRQMLGVDDEDDDGGTRVFESGLGGMNYSYKGVNYTEVLNPETGKPYVGTTVDGKVVFEDVPFGTYYVFETNAPKGYNLNNEPVEVTIKDTNTTIDGKGDGVVVSVDNYKKSDTLPATGTIGLMFVGGLTVASALGAAATRRKLKDAESLEDSVIKQ